MELCREKEISSFTCDIRFHFIYSIFIKLLFRVTVTFFVTVSTLAFNYYPDRVWLFYLKMDLYRFEFYAISIKLPNAAIFEFLFQFFHFIQMSERESAFTLPFIFVQFNMDFGLSWGSFSRFSFPHVNFLRVYLL